MSIEDDFKEATKSLATVNTRDDRDMPIFHRIAESGRSRSRSSYVRNFDGNVKIGNKFMDRTRHLQPLQLGGNPNNGKNDTNGKNDKIGTDGRNGTNE